MNNDVVIINDTMDPLKELIKMTIDIDSINVSNCDDEYYRKLKDLIAIYKSDKRLPFEVFEELLRTLNLYFEITIDGSFSPAYGKKCPVVYGSGCIQKHVVSNRADLVPLNPVICEIDDFLTKFIKKAVIANGANKKYCIDHCDDYFAAKELIESLNNRHTMSSKRFELYCKILDLKVDLVGTNAKSIDTDYDLASPTISTDVANTTK